MQKNSKKRQRGRIHHPCQKKTSWIFHIFINGEKKFEKKEEDGFTILVKERHLGLSIYPFINGEKKFEKEEEDGFSILVLPWRTIFHIFIGGVKI